MHILLRDGDHTNREIYQHLCDTVADLQKIPSNKINFGSLAYVIETGELYIADSEGNWKVV